MPTNTHTQAYKHGGVWQGSIMQQWNNNHQSIRPHKGLVMAARANSGIQQWLYTYTHTNDKLWLVINPWDQSDQCCYWSWNMSPNSKNNFHHHKNSCGFSKLAIWKPTTMCQIQPARWCLHYSGLAGHPLILRKGRAASYITVKGPLCCNHKLLSHTDFLEQWSWFTVFSFLQL